MFLDLIQALALMFPPQTWGDFPSVRITPKQNSVSIPRDSVFCGPFLSCTRPSPTPSTRLALLPSLRVNLCTLVKHSTTVSREGLAGGSRQPLQPDCYMAGVFTLDSSLWQWSLVLATTFSVCCLDKLQVLSPFCEKGHILLKRDETGFPSWCGACAPPLNTPASSAAEVEDATV